MLERCKKDEFECDNITPWSPPYTVADSHVEILDDMSAKMSATFNGPSDSKVIGRAWISDEDGTMVDGVTDELPAGSNAEIVLRIPGKKVPNGNLIACMRVECPVEGTKHVIMWTLLKGDIVHPPKGKQCE